MKIKTYVINLKESVDRKERVLAEIKTFSCMNLEFVEAVDGRLLSEGEINQLFDCRRFIHREGRNVLKGEIGCTLSHRICYRKIVESEDDIALILEDDVCFFDPDIVESFLKEISKKMSRNVPCVISLTRHLLYYKNKEDRIGKYSLFNMREGWGTCAYLINKKAAERMLSISKPYYLADNFLLMNKKGIDVKVVNPLFAMGASEMEQMKSEIERKGRATIEKKTFRYFLFRYWNGICRQFLLRLHILEIRNYGKDDLSTETDCIYK